MASGQRQGKSGSFVSNGASRDVKDVGFKPARVELWGSAGDHAVWLDSMADAHMNKVTAAGTGTHASTAGITPLATGFTIGADADLNATGETIYWWAEE